MVMPMQKKSWILHSDGIAILKNMFAGGDLAIWCAEDEVTKVSEMEWNRKVENELEAG
jgi:hypothetical protein